MQKKEKKGCRDLLKRLQTDELLLLLATVTNNQIAASSKNGEKLKLTKLGTFNIIEHCTSRGW